MSNFNDYERGDFVWKGDEVIWVPSEKGEIVIHPVLGPMDANEPLIDCIIGNGLAIEIDKALTGAVKKL